MPGNKRERALTKNRFLFHELMCTQCIKGKNSYRFWKKKLFFVHKFYLSSHRIYNMQVWHVCTSRKKTTKKWKSHTHQGMCLCTALIVHFKYNWTYSNPEFDAMFPSVYYYWGAVAYIWFTIVEHSFFVSIWMKTEKNLFGWYCCW